MTDTTLDLELDELLEATDDDLAEFEAANPLDPDIEGIDGIDIEQLDTTSRVEISDLSHAAAAISTTPTVESILAALDGLAAARPGYSQGAKARWSVLDPARRRWVTGRDQDCSAGAWAGFYVAGVISRAQLAGTLYSGNFAARARATGKFQILNIGALGTLAKLKAAVRPGDTLVGPGHVVTVGRDGRVWSAEHDERGSVIGGKPGRQTDKVGWRALYLRSKGWRYIVRLKGSTVPVTALQGRILAAVSNGTSTARPLADLKARDAKYAGWAWLVKHWLRWSRGMKFAYDPAGYEAPADHAFVVLGSALKSDGTIPATYLRRLKLAHAAALANPRSRVIISGGKPRAGKTEAAAGRSWLTAHGIPSSRILTEESSTSTVGNARGVVPLLVRHKVTRYTLVSDASHLRRASINFLAARLLNGRPPVQSITPLAYDDYAPKPVAPSRPISARSRATVAAEVASLLGLSNQYKSAL